PPEVLRLGNADRNQLRDLRHDALALKRRPVTLSQPRSPARPPRCQTAAGPCPTAPDSTSGSSRDKPAPQTTAMARECARSRAPPASRRAARGIFPAARRAACPTPPDRGACARRIG